MNTQVPRVKLSRACDLSTKSTTTFNNFSLVPSWGSAGAACRFTDITLVEKTKSWGAQSESVEFDICGNEERTHGGLFRRGDGFCSPAAIERNI